MRAHRVGVDAGEEAIGPGGDLGRRVAARRDLTDGAHVGFVHAVEVVRVRATHLDDRRGGGRHDDC